MMIIACGFLLSISIFLLLEPSSMRRVFGVVLLGNAVNLMILICGRLNGFHPAFIQDSSAKISNPLPQALILTAIVIAIGLTAFLVTLLKKSLEDHND